MTALVGPEERTQFLTFYVAGEEYGLSILRAKEILRCETITKVPGAPPAVRGVINVRGSVVPVVDLAVKFGLPPSEVTKWTCIIIAEGNTGGQATHMGVLADSVSQVVDLGATDIEDPPAFGTRAHMAHLLGVGKVSDKFVLILDMDAVLAMEALEVSAALDSLAQDEVELEDEAELEDQAELDGEGEIDSEDAPDDSETGDVQGGSEASEVDAAGEAKAAVEGDAESGAEADDGPSSDD